jgi:hypothetical protein
MRARVDVQFLLQINHALELISSIGEWEKIADV